MPIPVPVPGVPLPITDAVNASAEAALTAFVQLVARGTTGSSTVTPPITLDNQNTGTLSPLSLASAEEQLFVRHTMLAIAAAALLPSAGSGRASVAVGQTTVVVSNAFIVGATSKIFITPMSANTFWFGATGWWVTVVDGSFTLHSVNAAAGSIAQFAWQHVP